MHIEQKNIEKIVKQWVCTLKSLMVIYAHILKANKKEKGGKK